MQQHIGVMWSTVWGSVSQFHVLETWSQCSNAHQGYNRDGCVTKVSFFGSLVPSGCVTLSITYDAPRSPPQMPPHPEPQAK